MLFRELFAILLLLSPLAFIVLLLILFPAATSILIAVAVCFLFLFGTSPNIADPIFDFFENPRFLKYLGGKKHTVALLVATFGVLGYGFHEADDEYDVTPEMVFESMFAEPEVPEEQANMLASKPEKSDTASSPWPGASSSVDCSKICGLLDGGTLVSVMSYGKEGHLVCNCDVDGTLVTVQLR